MVAERTHQLQMAMAHLEHSYRRLWKRWAAPLTYGTAQQQATHAGCFGIPSKLRHAIGGLEKDLRNLSMGAWLHDIGKLATPDAILLKPGALTDPERKVMQHHVQIGYDLVKGIPFLADAAEIILGHHERCDGSGYPRGLKARKFR